MPWKSSPEIFTVNIGEIVHELFISLVFIKPSRKNTWATEYFNLEKLITDFGPNVELQQIVWSF